MKLLPSLFSSIRFYCSSPRSHRFRPLPLLLRCLASGEREVGQSPSLSVYWYIIYGLLCLEGRLAIAPLLPYCCGHCRRCRFSRRLLHCGGWRSNPNNGSSLPLLFLPFALPNQISCSFLHFLSPMVRFHQFLLLPLFSLLSLASRFLPESACFSFYFSWSP